MWYEEYDFVANPFSVKPQESSEDFFGQKNLVKKVLNHVQKGEVCVVRGKYGTGKTTILKGIIDRYRGKRKVAYYNAYTSERSIDYEDILVQGGSRLSTFFGIKSKGMILLLDEAHNLMKGDFERMVNYYLDGYFKAIILVTSDVNYEFPSIAKDLISDRDYELEKMGEEDAWKMVESRLEGVELLDKELVKKILKQSESPRDFLMRCEDACRTAVERGAEKVEEKDIVA
ncbi:MAG: AAA family ATPase [Nanobdellota archaeon]